MAYSVYVLVVLILAYVLAFIDRQILTLLAVPMKADLGLSDLQISLLQGLSFALFLAVGGLPIGRLVDRRRRTAVLAAGIAAWSVFTAACGLARSFPLLFLARVGVGFGEAAMVPSAYSLIGDLFRGRRLGLAIGLYNMGPYVGAGLALILGGLVLHHLPPDIVLPLLGGLRGWQVVFLLLGPMGLLMALWVATVREPQRTGAGAHTAPNWAEVRAYYRAHGGNALLVNLAGTFAAMALYSLGAWLPHLLARIHHMKPLDIGQGMGWRLMVFGAGGALLAGILGDFLRRRDWPLGRLAVMITGATAACLLLYPALRAPEGDSALAWLGPLIGCMTLAIGSSPPALQEITPNRLRGFQHAVAALIATLLGLGAGPSVVALVTDKVLRDESRLDLSLLLTLPVMLGACIVLALVATRRYAASLAAMTPPAGPSSTPGLTLSGIGGSATT
ncbi:MFS transporter [Nitrospirillum sp. BR 11163]|uniref:MFS transporter n=1 Tax=Nitrospirillum sp. BR 11163 TaxID=3104323 RepID=UPI002AFEE7BA|nr:MFS transporter [Nitrospirillum sp. BR 11163]MEA1673011.1 MFS transporter [Nitrospirillum sp. BR 11163]